MLKLYNTQTKKKEAFRPVSKGEVNIYQCGPTVYWYAHIGNLRGYIVGDILRKTLSALDFHVRYIMNITDVGHLVSDADDGEDKVEEAAKKEGKSAKEIATFYTDAFKEDLAKLHIDNPEKFLKATDHIAEQIDMIIKLEKNGLTYKISDGLYFDTGKFQNYAWLLNVHSGDDRQERVDKNTEKKHPNDFALWKFSPKGKKRLQEWKSPWGIGFPGWHIECSAMSLKYYDNPIDIHIGGIDHTTVHHPNEIAQAEGAGHKPFVNYWIHFEHLVLPEGRMGKSKGNILLLTDLEKREIDPLAYKYLVLLTHYRQKINFTLQALTAASGALNHLRVLAQSLPLTNTVNKELLTSFHKVLSDDINTPKALAFVWDTLKNKRVSPEEKRYFLEKVDEIFGLDINVILKVPKSIKEKIEEREQARKEKRFKDADIIREDLSIKGYVLQDTPGGTLVIKRD